MGGTPNRASGNENSDPTKHPDIRRQREAEACSGRLAFDRGNYRDRKVFNILQQAVADLRDVSGLVPRQFDQFGIIDSGREIPALGRRRTALSCDCSAWTSLTVLFNLDSTSLSR